MTGELDPVVVLSGRELSTVWLAVFIAASNVDSQSLLWRSVHVEQYPAGLLLTATDGVWLAQAFAPDVEHDSASAPLLEEVPVRSVVVIDDELRIRDLFRWVAKTTRKKDADDIEIVIDLEGRVVDEPGVLPGLEEQRVMVAAGTGERHLARVYAGEWVNWRQLLVDFRNAQRVEVDEVALSPSLLTEVARSAAIAGSTGIRFEWVSHERAIWSAGSVHGVLMALRRTHPDDTDPADDPRGPLADDPRGPLEEALDALADVADELTVSTRDRTAVADLKSRRQKKEGS